VASVDALQSLVVGTLNAYFYNEEGVLVEFFQIVEQRVRKAVGTCSYDQSHHIFYGKSLFIELAQMGKRGVGVGEGLEIGQVFHVRVFSGEELFALFQLLGNAFPVVAIGWVEGLVVAESASTSSHQSIAVRTCEPCVNSNLLDTKGELLTYPTAVVDV
jgi:hypothetical protein